MLKPKYLKLRKSQKKNGKPENICNSYHRQKANLPNIYRAARN